MRPHRLKHSTSAPYVFTEHGVTMLATVLKTETAVKASINIVKTFVALRHFLQNNAQYPTLTVRHTTKMHDRFLIIDNTKLYHIGASLKDLGKKCFAFDLFDSSFINDIQQKFSNYKSNKKPLLQLKQQRAFKLITLFLH